MDLGQLLGVAANALQNHTNGQSKQTGRRKGNEPTGVIPLSLGENERIEARYWENPVKDSSEIRLGYSKPRISEGENGQKTYSSYQLRHAVADIEATYRVCQRALWRHVKQEIALTEADRAAAEQVVSALASCFGDAQGGLPKPPTLEPAQLSRSLASGS